MSIFIEPLRLAFFVHFSYDESMSQEAYNIDESVENNSNEQHEGELISPEGKKYDYMENGVYYGGDYPPFEDPDFALYRP